MIDTAPTISGGTAPSQADADPLVYRAELRPHRSNTLKSVHTLMWVLAIIWVPVAVVFVIAGAWPVFPLMGFEILLLYGLLRLNLRRGREVETIAVTARALTVERINHWGQRNLWTFQPQWLQVLVDETRGRDTHLLLRSHGRTVTIGRFLTTDERVRVAAGLRRAISDLQSPNLPAEQRI